MTPQPEPALPPDVVDDAPFTLADLDDYGAETGPTTMYATVPDPALRGSVEQRHHHVHGWVPTDTRGAEWAMALLAATERQRRAIDEQHEERMAALRAWHHEVTAPLQRRAEVLTDKLLAFVQRWNAADPTNNRRLVLPSGEVPTRTTRQPVIHVADEAAAIAWARAAREAGALTDEQLAACVKVTESARISELRKVLIVAKRPDRSLGLVDKVGGTPPPEAFNVEPPGAVSVGPIRVYG